MSKKTDGNEDTNRNDIHATLQALTLTQKCALLSGGRTFSTRAVPALGIPALCLADGPHGLRKQAGASDHLGLNPSEPATCFPTAATIANSWNPDLCAEIGAALGEEAISQGVSVVLGPGLNIKRTPLCGRNFEYFSEDPFLSGKLAAGYIRGVQSKGVAACPKHFAVNNQETRRMASDSVVDERTLRELYLTGFEIAVKEGRPATLMTAYNKVNGVYANQNAMLLQEILRGEWGFAGAVVSDWGGSDDHALGVQNGSTLEMPAPGGDSVRELLRAVKTGKLTEADIDARVLELLQLIEKVAPAAAQKTPCDAAAHHALARKAAGEGLVLLKNEGGLLPLAPGTKVALIGDFAETPRYQGAGSSVVNSTKIESLTNQVAASGLDCLGFTSGFDRHGAKNDFLKNAALKLAAEAEVVLLCLGLDEIQESEGADRTTMALAQNQIDLLDAVSAVNPNVAVIFHAGSAVEMPWLNRCRALLYVALGGQAGAGAALDAVAGKCNPTGKLAETWPLRLADTPARTDFAARNPAVPYREGLYVGYRYTQKTGQAVLFPFGYGLSYTRYAYADLCCTPQKISFTVTNTGRVAGVEIAQLYVQKSDTTLPGPDLALRGFARVALAPGESRKVEIDLEPRAYQYWNTQTHAWACEGGGYEILIGASCADIRLRGSVTVPGDGAPDPYAGLQLPHYRSGHVQGVTDAEFAALLGRGLPAGKPPIDRNLTFGQLKYGRSPLGWLLCAVLTAKLKASTRRGKPDLNVLFAYNMPLRALAKMSGGLLGMGVVDGMVWELRGFWLVGLLRMVFEFAKNRILNAALEKQLKREGEKPVENAGTPAKLAGDT